MLAYSMATNSPPLSVAKSRVKTATLMVCALAFLCTAYFITPALATLSTPSQPGMSTLTLSRPLAGSLALEQLRRSSKIQRTGTAYSLMLGTAEWERRRQSYREYSSNDDNDGDDSDDRGKDRHSSHWHEEEENSDDEESNDGEQRDGRDSQDHGEKQQRPEDGEADEKDKQLSQPSTSAPVFSAPTALMVSPAAAGIPVVTASPASWTAPPTSQPSTPTLPNTAHAQPTLTPQRLSLLNGQVTKARQRAVDANRMLLSANEASPALTWVSPRAGDAFAGGDQIDLHWDAQTWTASYFQLRLCVMRATMDLLNAQGGTFGDGACGTAVEANSSSSSSGVGWQVSL